MNDEVQSDPQIIDRAYAHIVHLAKGIGPRGSCTQAELQAAEYVSSTFDDLGLSDVQMQAFTGSPTAYGRYALVFGVAILAQLMVGVIQNEWAYLAAGAIYGLAAWAMYAESDFHPNWTHWLIRPRPSQNVLACSRARKTQLRKVVISAHIDTHRTPFFNSNATWQRWYTRSFRIGFLCLISGSGLATFAGFFDLAALRILFLLLALPITLGLLAFIHADTTPFSPGAYDNASGVACTLGLAQHLAQNPLENTTVWFVATGCEETGAGGMSALVKNMTERWQHALWINLDQTGIGMLYLRLQEGMLRRYSIQTPALRLARAAAKISAIHLRERPSQAFSDAIIAHQHGLLAISLGASPSEPGLETPRHQLTDIPSTIQPGTLQQTITYVRSLISLWDEREQQR
ncbi:MAG: M20/M25/M40 family metallo-hydrolase [Anaerolineales bacterium]|nr:MAG: M20/M25/M40 family metallo-hydrolase [Anaerolineales bacterium]